MTGTSLRRHLVISLSLHLLVLGLVFLVPFHKSAKRPRPAVLWVGFVPRTPPKRVEEPRAKTEVLKEKKTAGKPGKKKSEKRKPQPRKSTEKKPTEPKEKSSGRISGPAGLHIKVMEGEEFKYSYYISMILKKIGENWQRSSRSTKGLVAVIYFEVERDGSLENVRVEEGSGDRDFDLRAERAILLTKRLPPLPQNFAYDRLRVHLEFEGG